MSANPATGQTILYAIRKEMQARDFYLAVAKKVKNPLVRRKLLGLADDELEHRQTLSRLYWAQTGKEVGSIEAQGHPGEIAEVESLGLVEAIRMAMEAEKEAVEAYTRMAREVEDERSRGFLEYLAEFEQGHYDTLAAELDRIKSNPAWQDQGPGDE